jgi:rare lipoprotein A
MPDPVVTQLPVQPSAIYIQAGSFTVYGNAQHLSQSLASAGPAIIAQAVVNGQQYYRVRVGPAPTVGAADRLLAQVVAMGHKDAIIIVD